jgi:hypothetical protein
MRFFLLCLLLSGCAQPRIYVVRMQIGDVLSNEFFEIKEKHGSEKN